MIWKSLAALILLPPVVLALAPLAAQTPSQAKPAHPSTASSAPGKPAPSVPANSAPATLAQPAPGASTPPASGEGPSSSGNPNDCQGGPCDAPTPHITIATPAPAPAPWPWQDRIAWGANLILVFIAYFGVMFGLSTLRKIERQSRYSETAAQAAAESAKAALLYAQAQAQIDRPWLLVAAVPDHTTPDSFNIVVTNRGRNPARIVSLVDEIVSLGDEAQMPPTPIYKEEPVPPRAPIILVPGESTRIKSFSRDEVTSVCDSAEQMQLVEDWDEKIYLYGNITYSELVSLDDKQAHETSWCCWYIHGREKSGMVMAGPLQYNRHT